MHCIADWPQVHIALPRDDPIGRYFDYVVAALNAYGESANSSKAASAVPFPPLSVTASLPSDQLAWRDPASTLVLCTATNLAPPTEW